ERVRVAGLAAATAPAARRVGRAEVGPLAQVRLADDTSAGLSQTLRDEGVLRGPRADERERAGRGLHAVGRADVVLDEDGDAVQRPAHAPLFALAVERVGD